MSAFEFFFSFYGLLLGLSVAVIATGVATAIQHRRKIRIGRLTPLLALFVGLDVASFWDSAWTFLRDAPYTYGLLVAGLAIALTYFVAASLVFPHAVEDGMSLDDHFWANKKSVLLLTTVANVLSAAVCIAVLWQRGETGMAAAYMTGPVIYALLVIPAAFAKKARLFAVLTGTHVVLYLFSAAVSPLMPNAMDSMRAAASAEAAKPARAV